MSRPFKRNNIIARDSESDTRTSCKSEREFCRCGLVRLQREIHVMPLRLASTIDKSLNTGLCLGRDSHNQP
jgi:hypothetical protein